MQQQPVQQTGIQFSNQPAVVTSQGQVHKGQPIIAALPAGQPVIAGPAPGQPVMAVPASGQPVMYQMPPGHLQPVFPGAAAMSAQGQPVQYYIPAGAQPVQQACKGQPVQMAYPNPGQGIPSNQPQHYDPDMAPIRINKAYLKSALNGSRLFEFISLLIAGACIIVYTNRTYGLDGRANFFRGITIFSWVMVIVYEFVYAFGYNKNKTCFGQPSNFTIMSLGFQVLLTILMISCTASLTVGVKNLSDKWFNSEYDENIYYNEIVAYNKQNVYFAVAALVFGYLTCLFFLDDIRLLFVMFRKERAQEVAGGIVQGAQQPVTGQVAQQTGAGHQQQLGAVAQPTFPPQATPQEEQKSAEMSQL